MLVPALPCLLHCAHYCVLVGGWKGSLHFKTRCCFMSSLAKSSQVSRLWAYSLELSCDQEVMVQRSPLCRRPFLCFPILTWMEQSQFSGWLMSMGKLEFVLKAVSSASASSEHAQFHVLVQCFRKVDIRSRGDKPHTLLPCQHKMVLSHFIDSGFCCEEQRSWYFP